MSRRAASALGVRNRERKQSRLHQKIEHDREDHWQDDVSGDIGGRQNRKKENAAEKECLRIGRQRHIRQQFFGRFSRFRTVRGLH
jgi:hypothetical protein